MKNYIFYYFLLLFITPSISQKPVFIESVKTGNGFVIGTMGDQFVILPAHILSSSPVKFLYFNDDSINIFSSKNYLQLRSTAIFLDTIEGIDLAVVRINGNRFKENTEWKLNCKISKIINNLEAKISHGYLLVANKNGMTEPLEITVLGDSREEIIIQNKDRSAPLSEGMSGSLLFINYNDKDYFSGILRAIKSSNESDFVRGYIMKIDNIENKIKHFYKFKKSCSNSLVKISFPIVAGSTSLGYYLSAMSAYKKYKNLTNLNRNDDYILAQKRLNISIAIGGISAGILAGYFLLKNNTKNKLQNIGINNKENSMDKFTVSLLKSNTATNKFNLVSLSYKF